MHDDSVPGMQLEKADPRVNYRECVSGDTECCGNCRFFDAECMSCSVVEGTIDASWKCSLWTAQLSGAMAAPAPYREPLFQVFVEASQPLASLDFTQPQWIPFLPAPGAFEHPKYGNVIVTPGQNREMVQSVKDHVYQEHLPMDAEHETKLSGAVAWIKDMRMNDNGSADAYVEFTDRGQKLLAGGAFKYVSPEWLTDWRDPATGIVHRNVIAGGAITTRPFFKDKVLRALVASEAGSQIIGGSTMPDPKADPKTAADPKTDLADPAKDPVKTFTEAERDTAVAAAVKAAEDKIKAETAAANQTFTERLEAAEKAAGAEAEARKASEARVAALETKDRHQRFTDVVAGRGGATDGAAWAGDLGKHVEMLESLASRVGESDPIFTSYVEQQQAVAAQLQTSELFKEYGSGAPAPAAKGDDADAKLEEMAKKRHAADPAKSFQRHFAEVLETPEGKVLYGKRPAPRSQS